MKYNAFNNYSSFNVNEELKKIELFSLESTFKERLYFYLKNFVPQIQDFSNIIINEKTDLETFFKKNFDQISSEEFYTIILQLMDFHLGLEFKIGKSVDFLIETGQNYLKDPEVNLDNLNEFIFNALNLRSANGLSFIDNLANDGFFLKRTNLLNGKLFFAGKSLPIFTKFIKENFYVDTKIDSDGDGFSDRILVQITRPNVSQKVPVIMTADPYFKGTNDMTSSLHNNDLDLTKKVEQNFTDLPFKEYKEVPTKSIQDNIDKPKLSSENQESINIPLNDYFLARGFAIAYCPGLGTRDSDGFRTTGDRAETISCVRAIQFLSGKESGFYSRDGKNIVKLNWTNGSVAMTGRSYLGTLATACATENPSGLKTIISESAISNWYDYYRENGLVVAPGGFVGEDADVLAIDTYSRWFNGNEYQKTKADFNEFLKKMVKEQDRKTGNYNNFWHDRNYLREAENIEIPCLYAHGLNDWNVKPSQLFNVIEKATKSRIKVILHQGQHISPHNIQSIDYLDICNSWLTHYLYGIDNQIENLLPKLLIQNNREPDNWKPTFYWQSPENKTLKLGEDIYKYHDDLANTYRNDFKNNLDEYNKAFIKNKNIFQKQVFTKDFKLDKITISGQAELDLKITTNKTTGLVSAAIYEIEPKHISSTRPTAVLNRYFKLTPNSDYSPLLSFKKGHSNYRLITFCHLNLQNINGPEKINQITPDQYLNAKMIFQPTYYNLAENSKLRLFIFGADMNYTIHPLNAQDYQIDLAESALQLPIK